VLGVEEEEKLVLDDRAAEIASVLIACVGRLKRRSRWWRLWKSARGAVAEKREAFAMEIVGSERVVTFTAPDE
jgi:hypothetical protein